MIVGLTGPSGAGKSMIANEFYAHGWRVIHADQVVHELYDSCAECVDAVRRVFPEAFQGERIDRKKLAAVVFSDSLSLQRLNSIVHPFVIQHLKRQLSGDDLQNVLLDAPTLFESGADALCDKVICLLADKELRLKRIMQRDGLTYSQAKSRLNAQPNDDFYTKRSDDVLYNNGGSKECLRYIRQIIDSLNFSQ